MRSMFSATLMVSASILMVLGTSAQAQLVTPPSAGDKPKPVTTIPIRLALQSDLAGVGQYNGAITGDVSERMVKAIKEFQKSRAAKETGVLNPQERGILADTAKRRQE